MVLSPWPKVVAQASRFWPISSAQGAAASAAMMTGSVNTSWYAPSEYFSTGLSMSRLTGTSSGPTPVWVLKEVVTSMLFSSAKPTEAIDDRPQMWRSFCHWA